MINYCSNLFPCWWILRWSQIFCYYKIFSVIYPYIYCFIQSAKTRLGADCSSDHEFLIAKFRLKLKKVGKSTRPFRYDLNQIPYDYTVEVRNRFKGQDLIDGVPIRWTMEWGSWHCTGDRDWDYPQEKKMQKGKMGVWGGFTNSWEKTRCEKQGRKDKMYPTECRVPENSKER